MFTISITAGAEADLQAIYDHRLDRRGPDGEDGADALLDELSGRLETLARFPLRGAVPPELAAIGIKEWRQLSHPPYRIIYTVAGDQVTVAVIADARRDFATLLEQRLLRPPTGF